MHSPSQNPRGGAVGRWAGWSLVAAIAVAVAGLLLERTGVAPFAGGLLLAFGEAALVGGLADWFAVRALFGHPLGVPLPHTALIPRNRRRIVAELRALVENEWLPRPMLLDRVRSFDFIGNAFLPFVHSHKETLQDLWRTVARNVVQDVSPEQVAGFLARAAARALQTDDVVTFLATAARRARQEGWLEPLMRQWLTRLEEWAAAPESHAVIHAHLERAGTLYRGQGWFKSLTYQVAEVFGGLDLHAAATLLQNEIGRFAREQGGDEGHIRRVLSEGLEHIEQKLRDDPSFVRGLRTFLVETSDTGTLPVLFRPVLT